MLKEHAELRLMLAPKSVQSRSKLGVGVKAALNVQNAVFPDWSDTVSTIGVSCVISAPTPGH